MARSDLRAKIRLEGDSTGANKAIKETESGFTRLGKSIRKNALAITAVLASLAGAFRLVKTSAEQAGQSTAFQAGLAAQGIVADEFLAKLQSVSDGQIANADLILASNRALALGIKADDLPGLLETAAQASVKLGVSVTQAFNDITTGVGRASPLILDNLGIVVDAEQVYGTYAESIGVAVEDLTKMQRTQALTNSVIEGGLDTTKKFTDAQDSMTVAINTSAAAMKNVKQSAGTVLGGLVQLAGSGLSVTARAAIQGAEALIKLGRATIFVGRLIPGLSNKLEGASDSLKNMDDDIDGLQERMKDLTETLFRGGVATVEFGLGLREAEGGAAIARPAIEGVADSAEKVTDESKEAGAAVDDLGSSFEDTRTNAEALGAGMATATQNIQQAGVAAVTTTAQFDALAASAGQAAAVAAGVAGGGQLTQGGTRLRFGSTGSRLVNTSGRGDSRSAYGLSEFGTGGRYKVDADGNLEPP